MSEEIHWKKQVNILWLGQFVLMASLSMSVPFWPLFIQQLNASADTVGWWSAAVYSAPLVASMFSAPLWGKLGDKVGHKKMVLRAAAGLLITQGLIAVIANPFAIVTFRLLQGVFAGFIAAAQAYAMSMTPDLSRGQVMGKLQSATAVGTLIGPLFGGLIASYAGYQNIFSVSALICAITLVYLLLCLKQVHHTNDELTVEKKSMSEVLVNTKKRFSIKIMVFYFLLLIAIAQMARFIFTPFFALFVTEKLGGTNFEVGLLYSATGFTVFLSATYWGKLFDKRLKQSKNVQYILVSLMLSACILQLLMAFATHVYVVLILRLLWGICLGGILPVLFTLLIHVGGSEKKGGIVGFGQSANKLGELIGISLGAFSQEIFGFVTSIHVIAGLYLLLALILLASKNIFAQDRFASEPI